MTGHTAAGELSAWMWPMSLLHTVLVKRVTGQPGVKEGSVGSPAGRALRCGWGCGPSMSFVSKGNDHTSLSSSFIFAVFKEWLLLSHIVHIT